MKVSNLFNKSYIKELQKDNLRKFLGGGITDNIPDSVKNPVSNILETNYIEIGKDIIHNIKTNKQLRAKFKELGFEFYGILGDGALFITEKHDEKLKTFIEKTSYIGNFLMIPMKTLGIVVFNVVMGAAGTVPGVSAAYRVLKLGQKMFDVSGKTLELLLRIGTGNWEEFNNMLQLLLEAFVMIPKALRKLLQIIEIGKQIGKALRGEEIEVDEDFMEGGIYSNMNFSKFTKMILDKDLSEETPESSSPSDSSGEGKENQKDKKDKKGKKGKKGKKKTKKRRKK